MLTSILYYTLLTALACLIVLACRQGCRRLKTISDNNPQLQHTVKNLRLFKMLQFIGADFHTYLNRLPEEEIQLHVQRCKACPNLESCDHCLRDGHPPKDMSFCPNYPRLIELSRKLGPDDRSNPKYFNRF
ncbi:MAG: DUF6455 family protein [Gammaproteobacteria bacterium]|nr:DUF6455 family protein [Gammaproteobacteria bacterium]MDH5801947.1 DUF6455 family protein [Gammaproteobacteria bacterium]